MLKRSSLELSSSRSGLGSEVMKLADRKLSGGAALACGWIPTAFRRLASMNGWGIAPFGVIQDYPPGYSRLFLQKRL